MNRAIPAFATPLLLLTACSQAEVGRAPAVSPPAVAADPKAPLASVGGVPVTRTDLPAEVLDELKSMRNEALQRELHLQFVAVDEAINQRLIAREAGRRKVTVQELETQEVDSKVVAPTDEEVNTYYEQNKDRIPVSLKLAAPHIKDEMRKQRRNELQRAFVERLRTGVDIRYSLDVPDLPRFDIETGDSPSQGPADAKVVLVEFADFQCPYCRRANHVIQNLEKQYPKSLRVVYRNFPLPQHEDARAAAEAAHCAYEQGKFWPYHDLLFDNANALKSEDLRKYAEQAKLDLDAFDACFLSDRPKAAVDADVKAANSYHLDGTPSIYVDGIKLIGVLPLPVITAVIDHELSRGK